jgi:hypothetical protein
MDRLTEIFQRQSELEDRYGPIEQSRGFYAPERPNDLDDPHDQQAFRDNNAYLVEELFEATNLLKNKPWKQTRVVTDRSKFYEEMGDAVHFFLKSFLLVFGDAEAAADALHQLYMGKSEINQHRQETKY